MALLAGRYGPSVVLLEHCPAPGTGEGAQTLDLVRIGADGSAHWLRVWPTSQENPRHGALEHWMAVHGHQIVGRHAAAFDWYEATLISLATCACGVHLGPGSCPIRANGHCGRPGAARFWWSAGLVTK